MSDTVNPLLFPVVMTAAGALPLPPTTLLANLIQLVTYGTDPTGAQVMTPDPGYTASLPGSMIEDISSTDTASNVLSDLARVELLNSLSPYGCNVFVLQQLGILKGVPPGVQSNMSVPIVFTGTPNYIIQAGFQVTDGTHTYIVQTGGTTGNSGTSPPLTAVATATGIWTIPANSVTQLATSVPSSVSLACNNPTAGQAGTVVETEQSYRVRVLQAELATCQGTPAFVKTLLMAIPGVVATQVAIQVESGIGYKVICGGSNPDPGQIAAAIYFGMPDLSMLIGSVMSIGNITNANPGLVVTNLNHGYATGQVVTFSGIVGMTELNTGSYTITVVDEKSFTIGVDTTSYTPYVSGGVVSPNLRNVTETIVDYPDTYVIPYVVPPAQTVGVALTWNTATPFASGVVFDQLAQTAIINYINAIPVGAPINIFAMQEAVQVAVADLVPLSQLSRMIWNVTINGYATPPISGTGLIEGDPESYFTTNSGSVTVVQG